MALTPVTEFFNGGIVTVRHPALLNAGELQRADECVYRDKDPAIWRAPGRTALNTAFTAGQDPSTHGVKGQAHLSFENTRTDQVIAYVGTTFFRSNFTGIAGTPASTLSFEEIGGPGAVAGTVTSTTTFTATTGYPFLGSIIGSRVFNSTDTSIYVSAVSGQDGTTGHYNIITLSGPLSNGATTLAFEWGVVQTLQDNGTTDEFLETSQYGGSYFAWTGRGNPQLLSWRKRRNIAGTAYDDVLSMRPVGLDPVVDQPTATQITTLTDGTAAAWAPTLGAGYFWFLVTEIFRDPDGLTEIESAYLGRNTEKQSQGDPVAVNIPASTGYGVRITLPAPKNNGQNGRLATHWGIYMGGPTSDNTTPPAMATFRRVSLRAITAWDATQTVELSDTRFNQGWKSPSVNAGAADGRPEMTNPSNMLNGPGTGFFTTQVARSKSGSDTTGSEQQTGVNKLKTFGWATASPWASRQIIGITVKVRGGADPSGNAGRSAGYYVYLTAGSKTSPLVVGAFGSQDLHDNYHGGEMDTWGVAWTTADFDSNWSIVIGKTGTGSRQRLMVDYVQVFVHWTSGSLNLLGKPYRVVTYRDQIGTTVSQPAYGLIKEISTGDFFEGCFVTNDKGDETAIRFSVPGAPEYFPGPYVMRFNTTKRKDTVTCIRTIGQILVVGLKNSIKRVNTLPRETIDLGDGTVQEDLTVDHGIAGPLCAAKFDMPGQGSLLFYVSKTGPYITDGQTTHPANIDLDWPNTVKLSALSSAVVRIYPKEKWITVDYCPAGATHTKNTKRLLFCYSADKIKQGGFLPSVGPITVSGRSSCEVVFDGTDYLFSGHETDGKIYLEDYSVAQASGYQVHNAAGSLAAAAICPVIRTRKFYPAGFDRDGYGEALYLLFSSYGSSLTLSSSVLVKDNTTITVTSTATLVAGMRARGTGLDPGTIVKSITDGTHAVLSRAPNTSGTVTLTFDTGTLGLTVRGNSVGEIPLGLSTDYVSTLVGDLVHVNRANIRRGFELQIEKVPLTFDTSSDANGIRYETATSSDLGTNMRLHNITYMVEDGGPDVNRNAA